MRNPSIEGYVILASSPMRTSLTPIMTMTRSSCSILGRLLWKNVRRETVELQHPGCGRSRPERESQVEWVSEILSFYVLASHRISGLLST